MPWTPAYGADFRASHPSNTSMAVNLQQVTPTDPRQGRISSPSEIRIQPQIDRYPQRRPERTYRLSISAEKIRNKPRAAGLVSYKVVRSANRASSAPLRRVTRETEVCRLENTHHGRPLTWHSQGRYGGWEKVTCGAFSRRHTWEKGEEIINGEPKAERNTLTRLPADTILDIGPCET